MVGSLSNVHRHMAQQSISGHVSHAPLLLLSATTVLVPAAVRLE